MDYSNTKGVNAYNMNSIELKAGYEAKVPINDNGFEYPISFISLDVVRGFGYYAQDLIINESYYTIDQGNLYFTKPLEEIISELYPGFDDALKSGLPQSLIYYNIHVYFDVFVPDTTKETHALALTQATQHAVMDYFNQYTFAEVTANMISEIAYTETLTFWSTFISSFAMYAGSWAVGGVTLQSFAMAGVLAVKSAIFEVFDEIIQDAFIEALIENTVDMWGWSEDAAMWLSALGTSARETFGALGKLMRGFTGKTDLQTDIALLKYAIKAGNTNAQVEIAQRIDQAMQEQQDQKLQDQEQKSAWTKLLKSGFFKAIFMVMPAILFGSFNFLTLKGLSTIGKGAISLAPEKFAAFKAKMNAFKKGKTGQLTGESSQFHWKGLKELLKKPSGLDSTKEDINNAFKDRQESDTELPPPVQAFPSVNSNPTDADYDAAIEIFKKIHPGEGPETGFDIIGEFHVWYESLGGDISEFTRASAEDKELKDDTKKNQDSLKLGEIRAELLKSSKLLSFTAKNSYTKEEMIQLLRLSDSNINVQILLNGEKLTSGDSIINPGDIVTIIPYALNLNIDNELHNLADWRQHSTYTLIENIEAILTSKDPSEVSIKELVELLGVSKGLFYRTINKLTEGKNVFFEDYSLYLWLFNVDNNGDISIEGKKGFSSLIADYRENNNLKYEDADVDNLIGKLRIAIQYDEDYRRGDSERGPTNTKLCEFFDIDINNRGIFGRGVRSVMFSPMHINKFIYGLHRKGFDRFILDNLGEASIAETEGIPLSVQKSFIALNGFCRARNYFDLETTSPLQRLILVSSWYISDINNDGVYLKKTELSDYFSIQPSAIWRYLTGTVASIANRDLLLNIQNIVTDLKEDIRPIQRELIDGLYHQFIRYNSRIWPGVHNVLELYIGGGESLNYDPSWSNPGVMSRHYVELLIKQAGLLPAGQYGEGADYYDVSGHKFRHHFKYYKPSIDPLDLILLGSLHYKYTNLEPLKDLDYYNRMQYIKNGFEQGIPPSFWEKELQDLYIKRLKDSIIEWETTGKIGFIKVRIEGTIYGLEELIYRGWVSKEWVDGIIADLKASLINRGLF